MTELDDEFELPQLTEPCDAETDEREPFLHAVTSQTPWCLWSIMIHVLVIAVIGIATALTDDPERIVDVEMIRDPGTRETTELCSPDIIFHHGPMEALIPRDQEAEPLPVERYQLYIRDIPAWVEQSRRRNSYDPGEAHLIYRQPTLADPFPPLCGFEAITDSGGLYAMGNSIGFKKQSSSGSFYQNAANIIGDRFRSLFHALTSHE